MDDHLFKMGNESDAQGSVVITFVRIAKPIRELSLIPEDLLGYFIVDWKWHCHTECYCCLFRLLANFFIKFFFFLNKDILLLIPI